jgi:hypothetical protein
MNLSATILTVLALGLVTIHVARADAFVELASTNSPRFHPTATLLTNGQVLVAGGGGDPIFRNVATAEIYDPPTLAWSPVGSMFTPRVAHKAVLLPSGKVLVAGGSNNDTNLASAELYDPFTKTWTLPSCRQIGPAEALRKSFPAFINSRMHHLTVSSASTLCVLLDSAGTQQSLA